MSKKPGDVVIVNFPHHDGGSKFRPAIVLEASEDISGNEWLWVAYGTSQHTSDSEHLPGEFLISQKHGPSVFGAAGLRKDTRFVLTVHARIDSRRAKRIGCVHTSMMRNFYQAAKEAGLV